MAHDGIRSRSYPQTARRARGGEAEVDVEALFRSQIVGSGPQAKLAAIAGNQQQLREDIAIVASLAGIARGDSAQFLGNRRASTLRGTPAAGPGRAEGHIERAQTALGRLEGFRRSLEAALQSVDASYGPAVEAAALLQPLEDVAVNAERDLHAATFSYNTACTVETPVVEREAPRHRRERPRYDDDLRDAPREKRPRSSKHSRSKPGKHDELVATVTRALLDLLK
jgi:hypothetical protein